MQMDSPVCLVLLLVLSSAFVISRPIKYCHLVSGQTILRQLHCAPSYEMHLQNDCARLCLLQAHYRDYNQMTFARCILVLHNMAHQGRGPFREVDNFELNDFYKQQFW